MAARFEYRDLEADELASIPEFHDNGYLTGYQRVGPKGYLLPAVYKKIASDILHMSLRPDDIFINTFPRSGTTWAQELIWLLANDLDYEKAAATPLTQRYPYLEKTIFYHGIQSKESSSKTGNYSDINKESHQVMAANPITAISDIAETPSPRFIKTHLPMSFLPPGLLDTVKVVYVARDPRDVVVSNFHFIKLFPAFNFTGNFKQFWNLFQKDMYRRSPYFEHVKEAWEMRHHKNILFLFYEDLSRDMPASIRRVAEFLGKEPTQAQVERLCDHLSIDNFKKNPSVNIENMRKLGFLANGETFIRKGKCGGWREYFDEEMREQAARWIADNLRDTDLRFPSMEGELTI